MQRNILLATSATRAWTFVLQPAPPALPTLYPLLFWGSRSLILWLEIYRGQIEYITSVKYYGCIACAGKMGTGATMIKCTLTCDFDQIVRYWVVFFFSLFWPMIYAVDVYILHVSGIHKFAMGRQSFGRISSFPNIYMYINFVQQMFLLNCLKYVLKQAEI